MTITGRLFTGKPMTSPDHLGPSHSASEVTIATVSADAAARVASRTPEISIRLKRARSGRPRTNQPAPPDTAAAKRTTRPRMSGIAPKTAAARTKLAAPRPTPAQMEVGRGVGTILVAAR